jgi:hypothetical protein
MKPTHYTVCEGGYWIPWPYGQLSAAALDYSYKMPRLIVEDGLDGIAVHGLKFGHGIEWDSISGFRNKKVAA